MSQRHSHLHHNSQPHDSLRPTQKQRHIYLSFKRNHLQIDRGNWVRCSPGILAPVLCPTEASQMVMCSRTFLSQHPFIYCICFRVLWLLQGRRQEVVCWATSSAVSACHTSNTHKVLRVPRNVTSATPRNLTLPCACQENCTSTPQNPHKVLRLPLKSDNIISR